MSSSTGRAAFQLIGTAIGSYFGPIGAAVGGFLGSVIGTAIFGTGVPNQFGPRLTDLRIQSGNYGRDIPEVWGSWRLAGTVMWATDLRETARTEEVEGKGGGGPEVTTYTYDVDFAVALCEGPIAGVRRIWANEKLLFDAGSGGDIATLIASQKALGNNIRVYVGSETQQPDSAIEADVGVGNAPAYRGTAYIVFERLQLEEFGNRIPNITAEVIGSATVVEPQELAQRTLGVSGHGRLHVNDAELVFVNENQTATAMDLDGQNERATARTPAQFWPPQCSAEFGNQDALLLYPLRFSAFSGFGNGALAYYALIALSRTPAAVAQQRIIQCRRSGLALAWEQSSGDLAPTLSEGDALMACAPSADRFRIIVLLADPDAGGGVAWQRWIIWQFNPITRTFNKEREGTVAPGVEPIQFAGAMRSRDGGAAVFYAGMLESNGRYLWGTGSPIDTRCYEIGGDDVLRELAVFTKPVGLPSDTTVSLYADNGLCWVLRNSTLEVMTRLALLPNDGQPLATVVSDLCARGGLEAADIDVTNLAGTVRGFCRTRRMRVRDALAELVTGFGFDAVESDGKIKFRMRSGTVVATIPATDLGASDRNGEQPPAAIDTERAQESELPAQIDLTYVAQGADYQPGTQTVRRLAVDSEQQVTVELPIAFTDAEAANVAARLLYESWVGRNRRRLAVPRNWAKLEPTDVVDVQTEAGNTYRVRIDAVADSGGVREIEGIDVDAAALAATATGATVPGAGAVPPRGGDTLLALMSLPPLRDEDIGFGYYVAMTGRNTAWPGGILQTAPEGRDFQTVATTTVAAVVGEATSVLGRWGADGTNDWPVYRGFYVDEINSVDVSIASGELSSCTYAEFLDLQNVALIGNEILAFREAELLSAGRYRLRGLLRGLKGTEYFAACATPGSGVTEYYDPATGYQLRFTPAQRDGHRIGERFVLLREDLLRRVGVSFAQINQPFAARAVTFGQVADLVEPDLYAVGSDSVLQLPPVRLHAQRDAATGNITFYWTRRPSTQGSWDSGREVPNLETSEQYALWIQLVPAGGSPGGAGGGIIYVNGAPPLTLDAAQIAALNGNNAAYFAIDWHVAQVPDEAPGSIALLGDIYNFSGRWAHAPRLII